MDVSVGREMLPCLKVSQSIRVMALGGKASRKLARVRSVVVQQSNEEEQRQ